MDLVASAWRGAVGFVERHKKAVALGAVAGVGTVLALRRMKGAAEDMMEGMQKQALEEMQQFERTQRLDNYLARTRTECQRNTRVFMPMIYKRLLDQLGSEEARAAAAHRGASREQKLRAWEEIKTLTLTRLFAGAYALAALSVVLRVQLHISQRHQYERICERGDTAATGSAAAAGESGGTAEAQGQAASEITHGFLMVSVEHMLGSGKASAAGAASPPTGLEQLVAMVHAAVQDEAERCALCRARCCCHATELNLAALLVLPPQLDHTGQAGCLVRRAAHVVRCHSREARRRVGAAVSALAGGCCRHQLRERITEGVGRVAQAARRGP